MAILTGKAPGKIILFGEHAVVYGQPAIAIPVTKVKATAKIFPDFTAPAGQIRIRAGDIDVDQLLDRSDHEDPLAEAVNLTLETLNLVQNPAFTIQISSTIPIAAGMGSGAAVAVAVIRGVSAFLGHPLPDTKVSELAFQVEKIHHGNPSGIDNNVVTYRKPVYYRRDKPIQFLEVKKPTYWLIADTGEKTPTRETVADLSKRRAEKPGFYDQIFDEIGQISNQAKTSLIDGDILLLGALMNKNQRLLQALDVSSPALDHLIQAAKNAGAVSAKLSGGGRGGNIIALVASSEIDNVENALNEAGAVNVIKTKLYKESHE